MGVLRLLLIVMALLTLNACTTISYTTASVIGNKLSIGTQIDDEILQRYASNRVSDMHLPKGNRVIVTSYAQSLLITGQVTSTAISQRVARSLSSLRDVKTIYNYLEIQKPTGTEQWFKDAYISAKVKSSLLFSKASHFHFDVLTEDGVVYLLGSASDAEENYVLKRVKRIAGVRRVVKIFVDTQHKKAPIFTTRT